MPKEKRTLYSYVEKKSERVSDEIVEMILQSSPEDGGILFVDGPMHSGKSIVACCLLRKISKDRSSVCAQPEVDRSDVIKGKIFSRSGLSCKADSYGSKREIEMLFHDNDVVIVDEIQFTDFELQSFMMDEIDKFVERGGWLVAIGLRKTSQQTEFLISSLIAQRALRVFELTSTCQMCGRRGAGFDQRLVDGKSRGKDDKDLLPPSSRVHYESRCKDCIIMH